MNDEQTNYLIEPLAKLARFTFDWAHCLCDQTHGCQHYHRAWSTVRLIETDGALPAGQDFFERELRTLSRNGRIRLLLSGAADTGLAALVLKCLRPFAIEPEMFLVDRCLTTLEQNRLFARHAGFELEIRHMDAAALHAPAFDAIIVHSFLGFFPPEMRQSVVDMWARNLAPHGRILLSSRLSRGQNGQRPVPDSASISERKLKIKEKAMLIGYFSEHASAIADAAELHWTNRSGHPQLAEDELLRLIETANLKVVDLYRDASGKNVSPFAMDADAKRRDRVELVISHKN